MKSFQKWIALGLAVVVLGTVTAFAVKGGARVPAEPEVDGSNLPTVADAAMYRGTVKELVSSGEQKLLTLEQAEGTNFGSPTFTVRITENTTMNCTMEELVAGKTYVEVMYGVSGGAGKPVEEETSQPPEAISIKLLPPSQFSVFNGEVVSVEGPDEGGKTLMSIMLKSLSSGEEVLFHVGEDTQLYVQKEDIKPGVKLNLLERGIRTMSIPAQGSALEVRPYYDSAAEETITITVD